MITARMEHAMQSRFGSILEYILAKTQDKSQIVALHACEFWNRLADIEICHDALASYLDRFAALRFVIEKDIRSNAIFIEQTGACVVECYENEPRRA